MHILQSPPWVNFKTQFGWASHAVTLPHTSAATHILYRKLPLGFTIAYIPKGPALNWQEPAAVPRTLTALKSAAARWNTLFLKIEPDTADTAETPKLFHQAGFITGKTVQPSATILIDLRPPEDDILAAMKSKTRYNIRLAARKGITACRGTENDLETFYRLSLITGNRDGFGIHPLRYYQQAYRAFAPDNVALWLVDYQGEPLAGLMAFIWDGRAYYFYGASSNKHRNRMPTYLLQWETIKWAKACGCHTYDLWGIPNAPEDQLEAEFPHRGDGLWGVYRFKRGFGGTIVRGPGAFDYIYNKPLYSLFTKLLERRSP